MAEVPIAPMNPNLSNQAMSVAGSQGMIFTATDRKLIEEKTGAEIDRSRSFLDVLFNKQEKPITVEVENTIRKAVSTEEIESTYQNEESMLEEAAFYTPHGQIRISGQATNKDQEQKPKQTIADAYKSSEDETAAENENPVAEKESAKEIAIAIAKELRFNPQELFDKFSLGDKELLGLVILIKDLHLQRLLTESKTEFDRITAHIKAETLHRAKAEAKDWLENTLDRLTLESAKYKLNLVRSLETIHFNAHLDRTIRWLEKTIARLSAKT